MASVQTEVRPRASSSMPRSPLSPRSNLSPLLQCNCGRTFTRVENLRRHQRSHEDSRRLACTICSRTFNRPDVLKRHLRTHRGVSASARSDNSPPRNSGEASSFARSLGELGHQMSNSPSPNAGSSRLVLPPRLYQNGRHPQKGDLPPIETLVPGSTTLDINSPRSRIPPSFPMEAPLPLSHFDSGVQDNDLTVMSGLLQDTSLEIPWRNFATLEAAYPAANDPASGFSFFEALQPEERRGRSISSQSPLESPPSVSPTRGEWSTRGPRSTYMSPADGRGRIAEVTRDPALDPRLSPWSRFWVDDIAYSKVKNSLSVASSMPGRETLTFRMPESLFTVNTLISVYFNRFYPQMPILHLPTFEIAKATPLLVAAFICVGASMSHIPGSRPFSVELVEIIRRTLGVLYERDSQALCSEDLVHAALLNCTAGISNGHQQSFELVEIQRTMLIQLCRKMKLLDSPVHAQQLYSHLPSNLYERWRFWISIESRKRLGIAIYLFDSTFPANMDMPGQLSQGEMLSTSLPCDDTFWNASTPEEWSGRLGGNPLPPSNFFVAGVTGLIIPRYARPAPAPLPNLNPFASLCLITALYHHIWEFRSQLSVYQSTGVVMTLWHPDEPEKHPDLQHGFEGRRRWLEDALDRWRDEYYDEDSYGPFSIAGKTLYHLGHIALRVHLRDLYAVAGGKHGSSQQSALRLWVRSPDAPVAAEHATRLLAVVGFPDASDNRYAPTAVLMGVLTLWVFLKHHGAAIHASMDTRELRSLFGGAFPSAHMVLRAGLQYMIDSRGGWKLCSAFAMALAMLVDSENGALNLSPRPTSDTSRPLSMRSLSFRSM